MTRFFNSGIIPALLATFLFPFVQLKAQPCALVDEIILNIYNFDFKDIPAKIENLKKTNPEIVPYLTIDFLWWKMVSDFNTTNETKFLAELNVLAEANSNNQAFIKLAYFIYQSRYENYRNKTFSKYLTILKLHFYIDNVSSKKVVRLDSFGESLFQLMTEMDSLMVYKLLGNSGIQSKKSKENYQKCLARIENIHNSDFKSFDHIKTYFLGKIYLEVENNRQKALLKFEKLSRLFPENTIFRKNMAECKKQLSH